MTLSRQVVVTGIGIVSPLGLNTNTTWAALLAGQSGIHKIQSSHNRVSGCELAGTVPSFKLGSFKMKHIHRMDPFIQYGLQAAQEAIQDADLHKTAIQKQRVGVSIGSGLGGFSSFEQQYNRLIQDNPSHPSSLRSISAFFIPGSIINMISGLCAIEYGFQGPNFAVVSACATGAHNIGMSANMIAEGHADIMVVGGAEMGTAPLSLAGFSAARALSTRYHMPSKASRPWDQNRDGFVLGDGAGVLVLEEYEHACARNAPRIYGKILGLGMSADAYDITAPEPSGIGIKAAMIQALSSANIAAHEVDYINAHATSTRLGDIIELKAIEAIWGAEASQLKISATKSMTGHLLGAAGAMEAAFCLLAIRDQVVPPTINLDLPDFDYAHLNLVPHRAQKGKINIALSNAFGFGGTNTSLIFGKL